MDVVSVNPTNFIGLSSTYTPDKTLSLNQSMFFTEQGFNFPFTQIYADLNDTTTNNYSNLYLTRYDALTSNAFITSLEALPYTGFSTYIGTYNTPNIDNSTVFLVVEEPPITVDTANIALSGSYNTLDNRSFFEVLFLDSTVCKVIHSNNGIKRYLTANSGKLLFQFDNKQDSLGSISSQIFYYIYDPVSNILVLAKSLLDNSGNYICEYVGYTESTYSPNNIPSVAVSGTALTFFKPIQGASTPYPPNAILRCSPQPSAVTDTLLYDNWVSYKRDFKTNSQDINPNRSVQSVDTNLLVNTEYNEVVNGNTLNVNILSLKNTNTPENLQSRNNPFQSNRSQYFIENDISSRQYNSLFTGSKQEYGNDNISLGYEAYTSLLSLPADKTTYFHTPQSLYPYIQINVADAGFIEAGAIAGDHPMKSDKIFKKLAAAKYTTPYVDISDETSGTFLCSWLSGGLDVNTPPIWVDRYYNPSTTTYIAALTGAPVNYITTFSSLVSNINASVFDKPSNLVLEPGAYYAYQHIGNNYVNQYLQSLTPFLVDDTFSAYLDTKQQNTLASGLTTNEFVFDGSHYTISTSLSSIDESNQFTLSFYGTSQNWQQTLGYQIVGNYVHDGFGIFNNNTLTPLIYITTTNNIFYTNTDFTVVRTLSTQATLLGQMTFEGLRDYYCIFDDNTFRRYDAQGIQLQSTSNNILSQLRDYDYTSSTGYIFGYNTNNEPAILLADFAQTSLVDVTNEYTQQGILNFPPGYTINDANAIVYYNGQLYLPPGVEGRLIHNDVYYIGDDYASLIRWNLTTNTLTTAFRANGPESYSYISDYNVDVDYNLWIINGYNAYYKYTLNRDFILSGYIPSNTTIPVSSNFIGDGKQTVFALPAANYAGISTFSKIPTDYIVDYTYTTTISTLSTNGTKSIVSSIDTQTLTATYTPGFEYTIENNNLIFYSAPGDQYNISVKTHIPWDSYTYASQINFVNEFDNGQYKQYAVMSRYGYDLDTLKGSYQINKLATNGNLVLSATFTAPLATNVSVYYGENYLRNYVYKKYQPANLNVKAVLTNVYNNLDTLNVEIITTLSAVDPGPHHFAVRFDSYHGEMALFIDGQQVGNTYFEPRKYKFSNLIDRPFMFGTATYKNNIPLFKYLQNQSFLVNGLSIYNYNLYNTPLNDFDIKFLARQGMNIHDINVNIPCGRRNYVEEIERYFKASVPGSKSTLYNLNITNTGITDRSLQQALEIRILDELKKTAPAYSQINSINWID